MRVSMLLMEKQVPPEVECDPDGIPDELRDYKQWVVWVNEPCSKTPKGFKEIPVDPVTHRLASVTEPKSWGTYDQAVGAFRKRGYAGIGFVLTDDDPFIGIELDHCIEDGAFKKEANRMLKRLNSYTEISPSGKGVKCLIRANKPDAKFTSTGLQVYSKGRYLTLTGQSLKKVSQAVEDRQQELEDICREHFGDDSNVERTDIARFASLLDDGLIRLAKAAKNGAKFKSLFYDGMLDGYDGNHSLDAKLLEELPGILAWTVRWYLIWRKYGLVEPESVLRATQEYRESQDRVIRFLKEKTVREPSERIRASEIYNEFRRWLEEQGERIVPTQTEFGLAMKWHGYQSKKSSVKYYLGIRLINPGY